MRMFRLALCAMSLIGTTAYAAPITYVAVMRGFNEAPPNSSPGAGRAFVTIDTEAHTLTVDATFLNLVAPTTAAHIHGPTPAVCAGLSPLPAECTTSPTGTAGVITMTPSFLNFPLGVMSGVMPQTVFDLTDAASFNNNFLMGATPEEKEMALATAIAEGRAYFNVHSSGQLGGFPGGEIRGFLAPVPEPATVFGVAAALGVIALVRRRRQANIN